MIPALVVLGVLVVLLVVHAVSPYPGHYARLGFARLTKAVLGLDVAHAYFAIETHAELRAELAASRERIEELEDALEIAEVAQVCHEAKADEYERALTAILRAQGVPLGYVQGVARAALLGSLAS